MLTCKEVTDSSLAACAHTHKHREEKRMTPGLRRAWQDEECVQSRHCQQPTDGDSDRVMARNISKKTCKETNMAR